MGVPQYGWVLREGPIKIDNQLGGTWSISGNPHMIYYDITRYYTRPSQYQVIFRADASELLNFDPSACHRMAKG